MDNLMWVILHALIFHQV